MNRSNKINNIIMLFLCVIFISGCSTGLNHAQNISSDKTLLGPIPVVPTPQAQDSVPMGDWRSFPEIKLEIPITSGPFEPTWESIENNYPGEPAWLRDAKFGIWVHFGPQSAGESGDWYARRLYSQGTRANQNHLKKYGHP